MITTYPVQPAIENMLVVMAGPSPLQEEVVKTQQNFQKFMEEMKAIIKVQAEEIAELKKQVIALETQKKESEAIRQRESKAENERLENLRTVDMGLSQRITNLESSVNSFVIPTLNRVVQCAHGCRSYISAIYKTLWAPAPSPNIPDPS